MTMGISKMKIMLGGMAVVVLTIAVWWAVSGTEVHGEQEGTLKPSPVIVEKMRSIGQWEFLSVSDEELVDTIRHGFFGDDELARIYYGTLRLGIDLSEANEEWIKMDGDTVRVTLPAVKLLDNDFIDEARTRPFIEDGKWTEADRAALTRKAVVAMRRRCLTKDNIRKAEENAIEQVGAMVKAMGFEEVRVKF